MDPGSGRKDSNACKLILQSLKCGKCLIRRSDLRPVVTRGTEELPKLTYSERQSLIGALPVHHQIFCIRDEFCQDVNSSSFTPWTVVIDPGLNSTAWRMNKDQTIRLAVEKLAHFMKQHLQYIANKRCQAARAPAAFEKEILVQGFWKVDPKRTGLVSLDQFKHLWNRVLKLRFYTKETLYSAGRACKVMVPTGEALTLSTAASAALFVKFGFEKNGDLPYSVFVHSLTETPARLLGHELILNNSEKGRNGLLDEQDIAMCNRVAKVMYPKCKNGIFPPSDFDSRTALRSAFLPRAQMWLEHVYGYAGSRNLANNVFYTHNTNTETSEIVYYTGMVGIVFRKDLHDQGLPSQRFFFGHDNDIECLAIHPNRQFVATGQQKAPGSCPYVCVWDVDSLCQLQRIDHRKEERSIIAVSFSGNSNAKDPEEIGGSLLVSITSDDKHTVHIWKWMTNSDFFCQAKQIPGWFYGPEKKMPMLQQHGLFFKKSMFNFQNLMSKFLGLSSDTIDEIEHPLLEDAQFDHVLADDLAGFHFAHSPVQNSETLRLVAEFTGFNGTPAMIYGVVWNPFRLHGLKEGSEFLTYGVKHLKIWTLRSTGHWTGTPASFGPTKIQNVLSAVFVPAQQQQQESLLSSMETTILSGMADGKIGIWRKRNGSSYKLISTIQAHQPGPRSVLSNGTQVHGGIRVLKLRSDLCTVISGGSDGFVSSWNLEYTPVFSLEPLFSSEESSGPHRFKLLERAALRKKKVLPMIRALDIHPTQSTEFIAGTDGCDIWEVDSDPRVLIEGHRGDVYCCAVHPNDATVFATVSDAGRVFLWDARTRNIQITTCVGFPLRSVAFSEEEFLGASIPNWTPIGGKAHVLAVGGTQGQILILDIESLKPLMRFKQNNEGISVLKFSPPEGPGVLAVASRDMKIWLYNTRSHYQLIGCCSGHSGVIEHLDWSTESCILQSVDTSREILYWNGRSGKQITSNQRDTSWFTYTLPLGFPVMGIWPDEADGTDVNSVCRSSTGLSSNGAEKELLVASSEHRVHNDEEEEKEGYLVTADDDSFVKLFNFPVLADDAPFRCYRGHSSHVMCIRFSCDDRTVFSVGGFDRAVFQWKTCGINQDDYERDCEVLELLQHRITSQQSANKNDSTEHLQWDGSLRSSRN
eukprot:g605.t1